MAAKPSADRLVDILRATTVTLVAGERPDLTARQLAVFLTCYLNNSLHTVRGLAEGFNVSRPAITRALDRLGELELTVRKPDPRDRRSITVGRTAKGAAFLHELRAIMAKATAAHDAPPKA